MTQQTKQAGHHEEDDDPRHQLWLIYSQLKDAENDAERRLDLLQQSREQLGRVVNSMNRQFFLMPKSASPQAADLNCRQRQFNLTPDTSGTTIYCYR